MKVLILLASLFAPKADTCGCDCPPNPLCPDAPCCAERAAGGLGPPDGRGRYPSPVAKVASLSPNSV